MPVTFVHHRYGPGGGMERYLADLADGFRAAEGAPARLVVRGADAAWVAAHPAEVVALPVNAWPRWWAKARFHARARAWLRAHAGEPTVAIARVAGARVAVCGGTHLGYLRACGRPAWPGDRLELARERAMYAAARTVVAHAEAMRRELRADYGLPAEKVVRIYPPVDTARFNPAARARRAEWRARFGLADGKKWLLFPSGSHRRKGFDVLLAAVRRLPRGYEIVVAGGRRPAAPAAAPVRYVGRVGEADMPGLYAACDATVMPSRYEPFGLVYVESALCGTPVVLPQAAGAAELLGEPMAAVCRTLAPEEVAAAIARVCGRPPPEADAGFAARHGLTVAAHVAALRALL